MDMDPFAQLRDLSNDLHQLWFDLTQSMIGASAYNDWPSFVFHYESGAEEASQFIMHRSTTALGGASTIAAGTAGVAATKLRASKFGWILGTVCVGAGLYAGYRYKNRATSRGRGVEDSLPYFAAYLRRRAVVVLGGDTPLGSRLVEELELAGFVVIASAATQEAAQALEFKSCGYVKGIHLDPDNATLEDIPKFLHSLQSSLCLNYPLDADSPSVHGSQLGKGHIQIQSIISLLSLQVQVQVPSTTLPPPIPLASYTAYHTKAHILPIQLVQSLLPFLRPSARELARARDLGSLGATSGRRDWKSVVMCIPKFEPGYGEGLASLGTMSSAATASAMDILRSSTESKEKTNDGMGTGMEVRFVTLDICLSSPGSPSSSSPTQNPSPIQTLPTLPAPTLTLALSSLLHLVGESDDGLLRYLQLRRSSMLGAAVLVVGIKTREYVDALRRWVWGGRVCVGGGIFGGRVGIGGRFGIGHAGGRFGRVPLPKTMTAALKRVVETFAKVGSKVWRRGGARLGGGGGPRPPHPNPQPGLAPNPKNLPVSVAVAGEKEMGDLEFEGFRVGGPVDGPVVDDRGDDRDDGSDGSLVELASSQARSQADNHDDETPFKEVHGGVELLIPPVAGTNTVSAPATSTLTGDARDRSPSRSISGSASGNIEPEYDVVHAHEEEGGEEDN